MSRMRISIAFGLGLFLLWSACRGGELPAAKIKVGEKMADFTLQDVNGKPHRLYEFEGRRLWRSSSSPPAALTQMPSIT